MVLPLYHVRVDLRLVPRATFRCCYIHHVRCLAARHLRAFAHRFDYVLPRLRSFGYITFLRLPPRSYHHRLRTHTVGSLRCVLRCCRIPRFYFTFTAHAFYVRWFVAARLRSPFVRCVYYLLRAFWFVPFGYFILRSLLCGSFSFALPLPFLRSLPFYVWFFTCILRFTTARSFFIGSHTVLYCPALPRSFPRSLFYVLRTVTFGSHPVIIVTFPLYHHTCVRSFTFPPTTFTVTFLRFGYLPRSHTFAFTYLCYLVLPTFPSSSPSWLLFSSSFAVGYATPRLPLRITRWLRCVGYVALRLRTFGCCLLRYYLTRARVRSYATTLRRVCSFYRFTRLRSFFLRFLRSFVCIRAFTVILHAFFIYAHVHGLVKFLLHHTHTHFYGLVGLHVTVLVYFLFCGSFYVYVCLILVTFTFPFAFGYLFVPLRITFGSHYRWFTFGLRCLHLRVYVRCVTTFYFLRFVRRSHVLACCYFYAFLLFFVRYVYCYLLLPVTLRSVVIYAL